MGNTLNKNTDIINISQIKDEGKSFQVKEGTSRKESTRCIDVQESNKTLSVIQEENHSSPSIFTHSKSSNKNANLSCKYEIKISPIVDIITEEPSFPNLNLNTLSLDNRRSILQISPNKQLKLNKKSPRQLDSQNQLRRRNSNCNQSVNSNITTRRVSINSGLLNIAGILKEETETFRNLENISPSNLKINISKRDSNFSLSSYANIPQVQSSNNNRSLKPITILSKLSQPYKKISFDSKSSIPTNVNNFQTPQKIFDFKDDDSSPEMNENFTPDFKKKEDSNTSLKQLTSSKFQKSSEHVTDLFKDHRNTINTSTKNLINSNETNKKSIISRKSAYLKSIENINLFSPQKLPNSNQSNKNSVSISRTLHEIVPTYKAADSVKILSKSYQNFTQENKDYIKDKLFTIPCLSGCLELTQIEKLIEKAMLCKVKAKNLIWTFESDPLYIFILHSGELNINYNRNSMSFLELNKFAFGDREIIGKSKRLSDLVAITDTILYCIPKQYFITALENSYGLNNIKSFNLPLVESPLKQKKKNLNNSKDEVGELIDNESGGASISRKSNRMNSKNSSFKLSISGYNDYNKASNKSASYSYFHSYIEIGILEANCFLFKMLPDLFEKKLFVENLIPEVYEVNNIIIHENEEINNLYIVGRGRISSCIESEKSFCSYNPGDIFGVGNLFCKGFKNLQHKACNYSIVYCLSYSFILESILNYEKILCYNYLFTNKYLSQNEYFKTEALELNNKVHQLNIINSNNTNKLRTSQIFKGFEFLPYVDIIKLKKDDKLYFIDLVQDKEDYILLDGMFANDKLMLILKDSIIKGKIDCKLLLANHFKQDLVSKEQIILMKLKKRHSKDSSDNDSLIKDYNNNELLRKLDFFRINPFFSHFSDDFLKVFALNTEIKKYNKNNVVYDGIPDHLYIIVSGKVTITKKVRGRNTIEYTKSATITDSGKILSSKNAYFDNNRISDIKMKNNTNNLFIKENISQYFMHSIPSKKEAHENDIIGLNNLIYGSSNEKVQCYSDFVEVYTISFINFLALIPKTRYIWNYFISNYILIEEIKNMNIEESFILSERNEKYSNNKYLIMENNNFIYYMKYYTSENLAEVYNPFKPLNSNELNKDNINPFNMNVIGKYNISNYNFIVYKYTKSCCFYDFSMSNYHSNNFLIEDCMSFWASNMLFSICHLHKNKIIHRDIRPINFNINVKGYLFLTDYTFIKKFKKDNIDLDKFNSRSSFSSIFTNGKNELSIYNEKDRTNTNIGNVHYMSPEVVNKNEYSYYVDFWSFGVSLYELVTRRLPFGNENDDPYDIYSNILSSKANMSLECFERNAIMLDLKDLISKLLEKDLSKRLTSSEEIFGHRFFSSINLEDIHNLSAKAPITPEIEYEKLKKLSLITKHFDILGNNK